MGLITTSDAPTAPESPSYEAFFGFDQRPFDLTPDPRFLYRSTSHDEAITQLVRAIRRREGFIVFTGDIGTGKTTVCRSLLTELGATTFTCLVLNPFVSVDELLRTVLVDFGVVSKEAARDAQFKAASTHELVGTLHEFLLSLQAVQGTAVLLIDEAQHLSPGVLEQIRVLSNLETGENRLLQIVLIGQLELLETLARHDLRQLSQRISLRASLVPLTPPEAEAYIAHRLGVAHGVNTPVFDKRAVAAVHAGSNGVPRLINLLCDRALAVAAEAESQTVTAAHVARAAGALNITIPPDVIRAGRGRRGLWIGLALLLMVAAAVAALVWLGPPEGWVDAPPPAQPDAPPPTIAPGPAEPAGIPPPPPPGSSPLPEFQ